MTHLTQYIPVRRKGDPPSGGKLHDDPDGSPLQSQMRIHQQPKSLYIQKEPFTAGSVAGMHAKHVRQVAPCAVTSTRWAKDEPSVQAPAQDLPCNAAGDGGWSI